MSQNRLVIRMFLLEEDKLTGGWRKLHDEELHNLPSSSDVIRTSKCKG
jgi:hypothetical protein